jgi:hypothetical protein
MKRTGMFFIAFAASVALIGATQVDTYVSARNEGRDIELHLTARYKEVMSKYDQDRSTALDNFKIAGAKRDGLDQLLRTAIEGRGFAGAGGAVNRGAFISAVKEAYPDLKQLGIYDKIADFVVGMRKRFGEQQSQLATEIQRYNQWRTTGSLLHPFFVSLIGFPGSSLEIRIGGTIYHGQAALAKMSTVVMTGDSQQIFDQSTDQPLFPEK